MPHNTANGLNQPNSPPMYCPSAIGSPSTRAPTVSPCMNAATSEPPAKPASQTQRSRSVLWRYSKATPRRISPASINRSGR